MLCFALLVWSVMRVIIFNHFNNNFTLAHKILFVMLFAVASRAVVCFYWWANVGEQVCVFVCSLNLWRLILAQLHVPNLFFFSFFHFLFYVVVVHLLKSNIHTYIFCCCCCFQTSLFFFLVNGFNFSFSFSFTPSQAFFLLPPFLTRSLSECTKEIYIHSKPTRIGSFKLWREREWEKKHIIKTTCRFFYFAFSIVLFTYDTYFSLRFSLGFYCFNDDSLWAAFSAHRRFHHKLLFCTMETVRSYFFRFKF